VGHFTSQSLIFRAKGTTEEGAFTFVHDGLTNVPLDFQEDRTRGTLFFARLPVGDYELVDVRFFINRAQFGTTTFTAKQKFSIPFVVREGHAVYLGEFVAQPIMGTNFFGMSIPAGGVFVVADRFDRDSSLLRSKEGVSQGLTYQKALVDPHVLSLPLFQPASR
jgi:hypothetical protein